MRFLLCILFLSPAFAQTDSPAPQDKPPANAAGESVDKSVIKPVPGSEAIKPKDYSDSSGYLHPFTRLGQFVVTDQKSIFTSPFHTSRRQVKWWIVFGGATGALIAADKHISKNAPNSAWLNTAGNDVSYLGEPYTLLPIAAAMYFGGNRGAQRPLSRNRPALSFRSACRCHHRAACPAKSVFDRQRPSSKPRATGNSKVPPAPATVPAFLPDTPLKLSRLPPCSCTNIRISAG